MVGGSCAVRPEQGGLRERAARACRLGGAASVQLTFT